MKITCKGKNKTVSFETNEKVFIAKIIKDVHYFILNEFEEETILFQLENGNNKHYKIINEMVNYYAFTIKSKLIKNKLYIKILI
jgi:hypothetical protein